MPYGQHGLSRRSAGRTGVVEIVAETWSVADDHDASSQLIMVAGMVPVASCWVPVSWYRADVSVGYCWQLPASFQALGVDICRWPHILSCSKRIKLSRRSPVIK